MSVVDILVKYVMCAYVIFERGFMYIQISIYYVEVKVTDPHRSIKPKTSRNTPSICIEGGIHHQSVLIV